MSPRGPASGLGLQATELLEIRLGPGPRTDSTWLGGVTSVGRGDGKKQKEPVVTTSILRLSGQGLPLAKHICSEKTTEKDILASLIFE